MKKETIKMAIYGQLVKKAALLKMKDKNDPESLIKKAALRREEKSDGRIILENATFGALVKKAKLLKLKKR